MRSKLFITLSSVALLGMSVAAYSATTADTWAWYSKDGKTSNPSGMVPQSDCLEMICEHGCVEKNNLNGYCCPSAGAKGDPCQVDGSDVDLCCIGGQVCRGGTCGCPADKPLWDTNLQRCVECLADESACKKCVDGNWSYPVLGSWVNNNPCQQCNGSGGISNVPNGSWINNNPCYVCDGNGGSYNVTAGSWVNNNPCQQCNGSGGINNISYGTWINNNPCQQCNGNGGSFNVGYNTPINGNVCQICNGSGGSTTLSTGQNQQSDGRCCVNGSLGYSDSYCPSCKDLTLGNQHTISPNCWCTNTLYDYWTCNDPYCSFTNWTKTDWVCDEHFGWNDTRTITVTGGKNMTLKADVLHIVNFQKYKVKDETTGNYLVNITSLADNSTLSSTVTLQAGHTYKIEILFENLCESCNIKATCN